MKYSDDSDELFKGLKAHLDFLKAIAISENEKELVIAISELSVALDNLRTALIEAGKHAEAQIDEKIDAIEKDDPWAKILSHRK